MHKHLWVCLKYQFEGSVYEFAARMQTRCNRVLAEELSYKEYQRQIPDHTRSVLFTWCHMSAVDRVREESRSQWWIIDL